MGRTVIRNRVRRAGLLDDVIGAVNLVVPRTAMPVIVPGEVKNAGAFDIKGHVVGVRKLREEMARVGSVVAAAPVVKPAPGA